MPNLVYMPGRASSGEQAEAVSSDPGESARPDPADRFGQPHKTKDSDRQEAPRGQGHGEAGTVPPCLRVNSSICRGCPGWEAMVQAAGAGGPWQGAVIHCSCSGRTLHGQGKEGPA